MIEDVTMTNRDTYDIEQYQKEQALTGTNIQIATLVQAMMEAEPCLFYNKEENLMANRLAETRGVGEQIDITQQYNNLYAFRGAHPEYPSTQK